MKLLTRNTYKGWFKSFMRYIILALSLLLAALIIAAGCAKQPNYLGAPPGLPKSDDASAYIQVTIYYPDKDALAKETHDIPKKPDRIKAALEVLFENKPNNSNINSVVPDGVKILGVKVEKDLAIINFNRNILLFNDDKKGQDLLLSAIISTASDAGRGRIKLVKFQVEGKEKGQIDGRDVQNFWGDVTLKQQPWKI